MQPKEPAARFVNIFPRVPGKCGILHARSVQAGGPKTVIDFDVSGSENFKAYLHIQGGTCVLEDRSSGKPDLMIHTPSKEPHSLHPAIK